MKRHRLFYGRNPGPLFGPLVTCVIVATLAFAFERSMPAFHDVVQPVYWILAAIALIAIWRWLRVRSGNRREADRRKADRPGDDEDR